MAHDAAADAGSRRKEYEVRGSKGEDNDRWDTMVLVGQECNRNREKNTTKRSQSRSSKEGKDRTALGEKPERVKGILQDDATRRKEESELE